MGHLGDKGKEIQEQVCATCNNLCKVTDHFVRENPWWTVGMVGAAALVVGLLLGQTSGRS